MTARVTAQHAFCYLALSEAVGESLKSAATTLEEVDAMKFASSGSQGVLQI